MSFFINGELFSGDPTDTTLTGTGFDFQISSLTNTPFSFFDLRYGLTIPNPIGLANRWSVYCNGTSAGTCSPNTLSNWSAAPKPATLALLGLGLVGIGFSRRRALN